MKTRINMSGLADNLSAFPYRLIIGLGFDQRSTEIFRHLIDAPGLNEAIAITNVGWNESNKQAFSVFQEYAKEKGRIWGEGSTNILQLADQLTSEIGKFRNDVKTVVDITSMSHELLAILIALLNLKDQLKNTVFCYTGAKKYSFNTDADDIWLSKGVRTIRSVLGFPGEQLPSRPLHLVIPMGFELERAIEVISAYEPAVLSLGFGKRDGSVSQAHFELNSLFFQRLESFVREQQFDGTQLNKFSFSCIDPNDTKKDILDHLANFPELNTVICPLNTKISTVGIALLCIEQPHIQLCYAQPIEYNTEGYATPDEWVTVFTV